MCDYFQKKKSVDTVVVEDEDFSGAKRWAILGIATYSLLPLIPNFVTSIYHNFEADFDISYSVRIALRISIFFV